MKCSVETLFALKFTHFMHPYFIQVILILAIFFLSLDVVLHHWILLFFASTCGIHLACDRTVYLWYFFVFTWHGRFSSFLAPAFYISFLRSASTQMVFLLRFFPANFDFIFRIRIDTWCSFGWSFNTISGFVNWHTYTYKHHSTSLGHTKNTFFFLETIQILRLCKHRSVFYILNFAQFLLYWTFAHIEIFFRRYWFPLKCPL